MKEPASSRKQKEKPQSLSKGIFAIIALIGVLILIQFSLTSNQGIVKGAHTQKQNEKNDATVEQAKERLQGNLEDRLEEIKKQVTELDPQDVVTSSPQVQKIIDDLKNLQGVPRNELKNVCESICEGL